MLIIKQGTHTYPHTHNKKNSLRKKTMIHSFVCSHYSMRVAITLLICVRTSSLLLASLFLFFFLPFFIFLNFYLFVVVVLPSLTRPYTLYPSICSTFSAPSSPFTATAAVVPASAGPHSRTINGSLLLRSYSSRSASAPSTPSHSARSASARGEGKLPQILSGDARFGGELTRTTRTSARQPFMRTLSDALRIQEKEEIDAASGRKVFMLIRYTYHSRIAQSLIFHFP